MEARAPRPALPLACRAPTWGAPAPPQEYWLPNNALLAIEFLVIGFLELKRYQGWKETGSSGLINSFPFDPAGADAGRRGFHGGGTAGQRARAGAGRPRGLGPGRSLNSAAARSPACVQKPNVRPPALAAGMNSKANAIKEVKNGRLAMVRGGSAGTAGGQAGRGLARSSERPRGQRRCGRQGGA